MRFRFLNKLFAHFGGYFWLPCPLCGQMFGGHEWGGDLMTSYDEAVATCPNCKEKADNENKRNFGRLRGKVLDNK